MTTDTPENKDLVSRLKDAGEDALQRLGDVPGGKKALEAIDGLRGRIDDLQKRMKRVDELEKRVEELEKKAAGTKPAPRKRTTPSSSSGSSSSSTESTS